MNEIERIVYVRYRFDKFEEILEVVQFLIEN